MQSCKSQTLLGRRKSNGGLHIYIYRPFHTWMAVCQKVFSVPRPRVISLWWQHWEKSKGATNRGDPCHLSIDNVVLFTDSTEEDKLIAWKKWAVKVKLLKMCWGLFVKSVGAQVELGHYGGARTGQVKDTGGWEAWMQHSGIALSLQERSPGERN